MMPAVIILICGVILAVLSILARKKLGKTWTASLLIGGILVAALGGCFWWSQYQESLSRKETLYTGLRYMEDGALDSANYYLKKVDASDSFESAAARALLELRRGNDLSGRLNLEIAETGAKKESQKEILTALEDLDIDDSGRVSALTDQIISLLRLPEKRQEAVDSYMELEAGRSPADDQELKRLGLSESDAVRLNISAMLGDGNWEGAVNTAVSLADRHPTKSNRLLLAETVAESAYAGVVLEGSDFARRSDSGAVKEDSSVTRERAKLENRRVSLEADLAELQQSLEGASSEEKKQKIREDMLEVTQKLEDVQRRSDRLYVYRAFNAIADIPGLKARLVRARLYFALQDSGRAVETLLDTAGSLRARLTSDGDVKRNLQIVAEAYESTGTFYESTEFRDAMTGLLTAPFPGLMRISQTPLTLDFVERIISDQKSYGSSLTATGIDTSQFPRIRVTLSGREDVLDQIVEKTGVSVRDTKEDVTWTARREETGSADICMVLDRSGSMAGEPMLNLVAAVKNFIENMEEGTRLSLTAFDDEAERLSELTGDTAALMMAADGLADSYGGTNITAGIEEGTAVLQEAEGSRFMLLMTDGQSSIDFGAVDAAAAAGITIYTVGFGDVNDGLLQEIADRTGGQYIRADSSAELENVYASLQQIIGNVVTLEYTAINTDTETARYFFLDEGECTVYLDYVLAEEQEAPEVWTADPALVTPEELADLEGDDEPLELKLEGRHLDWISSARVNGEDAETELSDSGTMLLRTDPDLDPGWVEVELTAADGTVLTFDRLVCVGGTDTYRNIRLGSLRISSAEGILPGDGTLVLGGDMDMEEYLPNGGTSTLSLSFRGTLVLPWTEPADGGAGDLVDLGDRGEITGWGLVTLNPADGAWVSHGPETAARGSLVFECTPDQSRLIAGAEQEVQP